MSQPAVFLDRDGTLNREQSFVTRADDLHVLPGAAAAVGRLAAAGFRVVVVTNQSGIARGLYGEADLARIHERLHRALGEVPAAYLHCPHHPDMPGPYGGPCGCRKPAAGLLHQAAALFDLRLNGSWVVGDSARDLLAARSLPLRTVLVRSGKPWRAEQARLQAEGQPPDACCHDLPAAVEAILTGAELRSRDAPP